MSGNALATRHRFCGLSMYGLIAPHLYLLVGSDSMVQQQMDQDWFRNVSNLDLVKLN